VATLRLVLRFENGNALHNLGARTGGQQRLTSNAL
jgi:hypothetical protein